MKSFWVKFGHADARSVVEARCAAVSSSSLTRFVLCCFCYLFMFKVMTFMLCVGVEKGEGCACCHGGACFQSSGGGGVEGSNPSAATRGNYFYSSCPGGVVFRLLVVVLGLGYM